MDLSGLGPLSRLFVQDRGVPRQPGSPRESGIASPPAVAPANGVPPPVDDVVVVSDAARQEFQAWVARNFGRQAQENGSLQQSPERMATPRHESTPRPAGSFAPQGKAPALPDLPPATGGTNPA
jgi:hypothetical protein